MNKSLDGFSKSCTFLGSFSDDFIGFQPVSPHGAGVQFANFSEVQKSSPRRKVGAQEIFLSVDPPRKKPVGLVGLVSPHEYLVGGLVAIFYFPIYWE